MAVDTLRHDFCTSERKVFLSKCKVSHSYSLKCKMNINVTDVITAKQDQKSELKASHTLIVCKVIKMDFHQREKRLILWLGVFFSYSLHLSHTERKMAWELQQHFFEIQSSKSSFFFFFFSLKDVPGSFPHWLYTFELHKTVHLCKPGTSVREREREKKEKFWLSDLKMSINNTYK